jgi:hypothetical protein
LDNKVIAVTRIGDILPKNKIKYLNTRMSIILGKDMFETI